jgi:hypothetical protein
MEGATVLNTRLSPGSLRSLWGTPRKKARALDMNVEFKGRRPREMVDAGSPTWKR